MIAHVAQSGEDRGRVVIQIRSRHPSAVAMQAAVQIARAFGSDLESLFVEDEQLFDCAAYGFVREVSLSGRESRVLSLDTMMRDLHLAAQGTRRELEALTRRAQVPLRCRVVRDEPLRALTIACAEVGRAARYLLIPLAIGLILAPFLFSADLPAIANSLLCGVALVLLALRRGPILNSYGTIDRLIV